MLYDTEFEAQLAADRVSYNNQEEMNIYQCPGTKHFHITHTRREERNKFRRGRIKCEICQHFVKSNKLVRHMAAHRKDKEKHGRIVNL